jgi:uncharacterized protein YecE (DUF72 family)
MASLNWFLGTMGFGYSDWDNVFYPPGLNRRDYLSYYSRFFNAVELDSTFYGTPRAEYVARWEQVTPDDFCFCPKMPRQITHEMRLRNATVETTRFLETMRELGHKLGPILIQFPPDFTRSEIGTLAAFLRELPRDLRFAVEFRHRSWHATATGLLLSTHNVAWVSADYLYMPQRVYVTSDFLYIRWIGRHGTYETKDFERVDKSDRLREWLEDIEERRRRDPFHSVFGFFNDEYAGFAPATTQKLKGLLRMPTRALTPLQQVALF